MAKEKIEQPVNDIAVIEAERKSLAGKIQAVLTELSNVRQGIEQGEVERQKARDMYNDGIGEGDGEKMVAALSDIKSTNTARKEAIGSLSGFPGKILVVQASYAELMKAARLCWSNAEEKLKAAQAEYKTAERSCDAVQGVLYPLKTLSDELQKLRDRISPPSSPPEKVASEQIEGNT